MPIDVEGQLNAIAEAEAEFCRNCGINLKHISGKKQKRFCCDKCRMEWHYAQSKKEGSNGACDKGITLRDKRNIRVLRKLGLGYQAIADDLKLKKHQVRDFCRYHGLTGNARQAMLLELENRFSKDETCEIKNYCWHCGMETKLTRKFCCDKCRYAYNYRRRSGRGEREGWGESDRFSETGDYEA